MRCMRRFVGYMILVATTFYMAVLYRSTAFIFVGCGELIAGILMAVYLLYMWGKVAVYILPSADLGEAGQMLPVDLLVSNRGRLPVGKVRVRIQERYPMFGEKKTTVFYATVPGGGRLAGETRIRLGFLPKHSGRIVLRVKNAQIYDFLGMLSLSVSRRRMGGEAILSIFPEKVPVPIVVERNTRDYAQEKEEQIVRGESQPKESWQIRSYQEYGDVLGNCPVHLFFSGGECLPPLPGMV